MHLYALIHIYMSFTIFILLAMQRNTFIRFWSKTIMTLKSTVLEEILTQSYLSITCESIISISTASIEVQGSVTQTFVAQKNIFAPFCSKKLVRTAKQAMI